MTPLSQAIDMAVRGEFPPGASEIDGHEFYIRSVKNKNNLAEAKNETSYFRHEHVGKDDRVFYSIKLGQKKGEYTAKITRIQFRGPFVKNDFRDIGDTGIDITDAVKVLVSSPVAGGSWPAFFKEISELDAQGFLDGNWVPAAAKVADLIGKRMAEDI